MAELLFRNEVIEASRNRLTGAVIAAVPPSSRLYTRLVAGVAAVLVLFLIFGSYTMTTDVRGVVAYDAGVARVYPREAAELAEVLVKQGQAVKAGDPLVTLTVAQGQGGMKPLLDQVATQDAELNRQLELAAAQARSEIASLDSKTAGYSASIASLQRQRAIASDQIELAQAALKRAERLASEGAGTQRQVEDSRSNLLARRAEYESLGEQIISQQTSMRTAQADRTRLQIDAQRSESELQSQRSQLVEQQVQLSRTNRLVLTSPIDGTVGDIGMEIGQRANPDSSVVTVIPDKSEMELWLYAPTRAVGNAKVGQTVRLDFDAFPHEKYGHGRGIVTDVATVPTEPGNLDPGLGIAEPVFRIRTRIVSVSATGRLGVQSLRPGMTVAAKLEMESRSLWQLLFNPIIEALHG